MIYLVAEIFMWQFMIKDAFSWKSFTRHVAYSWDTKREMTRHSYWELNSCWWEKRIEQLLMRKEMRMKMDWLFDRNEYGSAALAPLFMQMRSMMWLGLRVYNNIVDKALYHANAVHDTRWSGCIMQMGYVIQYDRSYFRVCRGVDGLCIMLLRSMIHGSRDLERKGWWSLEKGSEWANNFRVNWPVTRWSEQCPNFDKFEEECWH